MSESNSDSEDYCSSDDEDYLPSGEEYSEDDVNELVKEDDTIEGDENEDDENQNLPKARGKKATKNTLLRKRRKGGLILESKKDQVNTDSVTTDGKVVETVQLMQDKDVAVAEEETKKRADDLWASFLKDVGKKPKASSPEVSPSTQEKESTEKSQENHFKKVKVAKETEKPKESTKVKITKIFDFAGEEVRVTKEVDASSKEAKCFLKQQEPEKLASSSSTVSSCLPTVSGVKRPTGLSNIMGKLGNKKQKMSTLEKSKLDWESFKEEEGIGDELAIYNRGKEGYIERKAFLDRVDYRQFELERNIRLKNMKH
ncbi:LOW QUALITY PROTEIN: craniofacial development protein 1 [Microcaecilia unicolor]|uniref:Craniofacial development protein 1 n=1 Tax=Microcaecilia unicolor TaxID=1415580 RepID=A0A6P7Y3U4_9AMPH|nr:LOW QUALITY PROTEIN: craniofacial development protein 1 [Microcaecilia unicolor]